MRAPRRGTGLPTGDFEGLVRSLQTDVYSLCRHLGSAQAAEDLTQETFLRVYRSLPGFRGESSTRTWVLSIARRVCADHVARLARERTLLRRVEVARRTGQVVSADTADVLSVWDLIERLSPERRAAFVTTQILGLSYDEAAVVCDCPVGTIRSRVARARSELIGAQREADVSGCSAL